MIKQLSFVFTISLVYSLCTQTASIPAISVYPFTIYNKDRNATTQQFTIQIISKSNQFALAVNSMQSVILYNWNLTLKSANQTTATLSFSQSDASWILIGGIVWELGAIEMIAGVQPISGDISTSSLYQMQLQQTIKHEEASVAVLFLNGVSTTSQNFIQLALQAVRVSNQSIFINITAQMTKTGKINSILVSFLIFSPVFAPFQAYGDSLPFNWALNDQYTDVTNSVPPSPYKIYGITALHSKTQLNSQTYFNSSLDNSYVLKVKTSTSNISIDYLYLFSQATSCQNCLSANIFYDNSCVQSCPQGSILVKYQNISFCRICSEALNLRASENKSECLCKNGYKLSENNRCILVQTTPVQNTVNNNMQTFIPLAVLKGLQESLNTESSSTKTSLIVPPVTSAIIFSPGSSGSVSLPTSSVSGPSSSSASIFVSSVAPSSSSSSAAFSTSPSPTTSTSTPPASSPAPSTSTPSTSTPSASNPPASTTPSTSLSSSTASPATSSNPSLTVSSPNPSVSSPLPTPSTSSPPASVSSASPSAAAPSASSTSSSTPAASPSSPAPSTSTLPASSSSTPSTSTSTPSTSTSPSSPSASPATLSNPTSTVSSPTPPASGSSSSPSAATPLPPALGISSSSPSSNSSASRPSLTVSSSSFSNPSSSSSSPLTVSSSSSSNPSSSSSSPLAVSSSSSSNPSSSSSSTPSGAASSSTLSVTPASPTPSTQANSSIPSPSSSAITTQQTVKPIIPLLVSSAAPTSSNSSTLLNCSGIPNSRSSAGICVCDFGFIKISNHCVSLTQLVSNNNLNTIKVTSTSCTTNQIFSAAQNKCVCASGFRMNSQNLCQRFCSVNQRLNSKDSSCVCIQGFTRINNMCQLCKTDGVFYGNESCYSIPSSLVCRLNYTQSNGFCLRCLNITNYTASNNVCNNCFQGMIYNGSMCICPVNSTYINGTCMSPKCGDSVIQLGQSCDDGNTMNGDGCSSTCFIQSSWACTGVPSSCNLSQCGDGIINGGQLCDDNNLNKGDGCSQICLIQANFSCIGQPSACFAIKTGNLSLVAANLNPNNVYIQLQTPNNISFISPILATTFLQVSYLNTSSGASYYCQQQDKQDNSCRFVCLLIYPNGIPNRRTFLLVKYDWMNSTGSTIVEVNGLLSRTSFNLRSK